MSAKTCEHGAEIGHVDKTIEEFGCDGAVYTCACCKSVFCSLNDYHKVTPYCNTCKPKYTPYKGILCGSTPPSWRQESDK